MRGFGLAKTGGRDRRAAGASGRFAMCGAMDSSQHDPRQSVAQRLELATLGQDCGISTVGGKPGGASPRSCEQSVSAIQWLSSNLPAGRIALGEIRA